MDRLEISFGKTSSREAAQAVADIHAQIGHCKPKAVIFFCSHRYDLRALGEAILNRFSCPVAGCTTAGEIQSPGGYRQDSFIAASIAGDEFRLTPLFIDSLSSLAGQPDGESLRHVRVPDPAHSFGLFFVDGASMLEEQAVAAVYNRLWGIPLVGGSAGGGPGFEESWVYYGGRFHRNAAVLALCETNAGFLPFRTHHFEPTPTKMVITDTDPSRRRVREINGEAAAEAYARALGVTAGELSIEHFASRPLLLRIGGETFPRSIQRANADGSLTFLSAVTPGLVLTLARPGDLLGGLRAGMRRLERHLGRPRLILGFECVLRRLEMERRGELNDARAILAEYPFLGFNTYGEQVNGMHVNHTLAGIALGA